MSQQVIESIDTQRLAALGLPGHASAEPPPQGLGPLLAILHRRWKLVLALWLLVGPLGAAAVFHREKPTYTATAYVEVAPIVPAILYDDEKPMPLFDMYLNTQTQMVSSHQVLTAALADPFTKDLPVLQEKDPMTELRKGLRARVVPRTHLIEINVTRPTPGEATQLTKAVLDAYMVRAGRADEAQDRNAKDLLEKTREQLRTQLDQQSNEIRRLAQAYGTSSDTMFEILRESLETYSLETKQELERADLEIFQLQEQLRQMEKGHAPTSQPGQWYEMRRQAIELAPGVQIMQRDVHDAAAKVARLRAALGPDHEQTARAQAELDQRKTELEQERDRATAEVDRDLAEREQERLEQMKARLQSELDLATRRREVLKQRVETRDAEGMKIGQQGLEIQNLREQRDLTRQDYERVLERIKRLDIEGQRPGRISIASNPEIRPDGIKDKRFKLGGAALFGAFFFAAFVALVRDRIDPYLHDIKQVEDVAGPRLLGTIPAVLDVQAGRVSREQYQESFRVIRANLTAAGDNGKPLRSLLVTSAQAGEGKTSLAVSLAISLTESGKRILLIDGDLQLPQIARLLSLDGPCDLKAVLQGRTSLGDAVVASGIKGLDVLVSHRNCQSPQGILNTQFAIDLINQATGTYDCVVVDSPPALGAADALFWSQATDGVILASMVGQSDRKAVKVACQRLHSVSARLLGSVIANVPFRQGSYSYSTSNYRSAGPEQPGITKEPQRTPPLVYLPDNSKPDNETQA